MKRRQFINYMISSSAIVGGSHLSGCTVKSQLMQSNSSQWFMPGEFEPHERCWMAFPSSEEIWKDVVPNDLGLTAIQKDVATIANAIAQFEPVTMLVSPGQVEIARKTLNNNRISPIEIPVDDLWMRDSGPVFVLSKERKLAALSGNFNGWGNKQKHDRDAYVADKVSANLGLELLKQPLVLEGGAIIVDGQGTLITTESNILNPNRNPGITKIEAEAVFREYLGIEKVIWFPGVVGADITDGHIDGVMAYARPGVVLVDWTDDSSHPQYKELKELRRTIEKSTDARGRKFEAIPLKKPLQVSDSPDLFDSYINFYVANNGAIVPSFGDQERDREAQKTIETAFPGRTVSMIKIDTMMTFGGGGVRCSTQQQPLV
jgi:agmatine deiminase